MRAIKLILGIVLAVVLLGGGIFLGLKGSSAFAPVAEVESESHGTQVINSISRTEQIVLLSLGIQGIEERTDKSTFFGSAIPGSARTSFLQYGFNAKIGIEGSDVEITQTGDSSFKIEVPEFVFIGHDEISFDLVTEDNGALSWVTPEIDVTEMTNAVLNSETQAEYIAKNLETLKEQTQSFYQGIVTAVAPDVVLEFAFFE